MTFAYIVNKNMVICKKVEYNIYNILYNNIIHETISAKE